MSSLVKRSVGSRSNDGRGFRSVFGVELVDGTTPDVFFGGRRQAIVDALEDRGWRVEVRS